MLQIGDFSKLAQVSIKALRYYDEIGLLKPLHVDLATNYRYYSVSQLPRLNRIIALKEIGFSLDQIKQLLDGAISHSQMKSMLLLRQAEAEQAMQAELLRLSLIQSRLNQIEHEDEMPAYDVVIKTIPSMTIASIRRVISAYSAVGILFSELFALPIYPIGVSFVIYHDSEYREQDVDMEACVMIDPSYQTPNARTLETVTVAAVVHQGSYDTLTFAYIALAQWIEQTEYQIVGVIRELYLRGYGGNYTPDQFVTEIQIPIERKKS